MKLSEYREKEKNFNQVCSEYQKRMAALQDEYVSFQRENRPSFYNDIVAPLIKEVEAELKKQLVFKHPISTIFEPVVRGPGMVYPISFEDGSTQTNKGFNLNISENFDGSVSIGGEFNGNDSWKTVDELNLTDVMATLHAYGGAQLLKPSLDSIVTSAEVRAAAQASADIHLNLKETEIGDVRE